jgi:carboxymethylenebutenolidase
MIAASKTGGISAAAATMIRLLETDHLNDQVAALPWLKKRGFLKADRIALAGDSFGGIEAILGAERSEAGAEFTRHDDPRRYQRPNPGALYSTRERQDLNATRDLATAMKNAGKVAQVKMYPPFGKSAEEGHSFAYAGCSVWAEDAFSFLEQNCGK